MTELADDETERLRGEFFRTFASIYEQLAFLRLNEVAGDLAFSTVRIWDVLVPLRSSLAVAMTVSDGEVSEATIQAVGGARALLTISSDLRVRPGRQETQVNGDLLRRLFPSLKAVSSGSVGPGLVPYRRSLVLSSLWSDGVKGVVADMDVLSAANVFRHVVILGPPGSGKTTTARAIATAHLRTYLKPHPEEGPSALGLWEDSSAVPIYVDLKQFVRSEHFPDLEDARRPVAADFEQYVTNEYLSGHGVVAQQVFEYLRAGNGIIVLDGLDEVPVPIGISNALDRRRVQLIDLVRSLQLNYPLVKIVVTSRPAGYSGWTLPGFHVVNVRPVSTDEAAKLARAYYLAAGEESSIAEESAKRLASELESLPRTVTEFPLFVCLLASLYRQREGDFPTQRAALLGSSLRLLLGSWTQRRYEGETVEDVLSCTVEELIERLAVVALRAMTDGSRGAQEADSTDIALGVLLEELIELGPGVNPAEVLDFCTNHAGILYLPAPRRIKFVHRLFQEYLAALELSRMVDPSEEIISRIIDNPVLWHEVGLLYADILSDSRRAGDLVLLVEGLLDRSADSQSETLVVALAAEMITQEHLGATAASRSGAVDSIRRALASQLSTPSLPPLVRQMVGLALGELGDSRPGAGLDADDVPEVGWVTVAAGSVMVGTAEERKPALTRLAPDGLWTYERETPAEAHQVPGFFASRFLVTVRQFRAFVDAEDGYSRDEWWTEAGLRWRNSSSPPLRYAGADNLPQTGVTWFEALAYCHWLSAKYQFAVRLPTTIEWERMAKRLGDTAFPWGDDPDSRYANTLAAGLGEVTPVGCFLPTSGLVPGEDLYDLIGNVWEWCSTVAEVVGGHRYTYPYRTDDDRESPAGGIEYMRVVRGGYHDAEWMMARSSYPGRDQPDLRVDRQGFRVVADQLGESSIP